MGFLQKYIEKKKKESAENRAFKKVVAERVKVARRQGYAKQAVISARISAQKKASRIYNPPIIKRQGMAHQGQSPLFQQLAFGSVQKQPQLQREIIKRSKKRTKRKIKPIRKQIKRVIKQEKTNEFDKVFWNN